jgi:hypothetical protein
MLILSSLATPAAFKLVDECRSLPNTLGQYLRQVLQDEAYAQGHAMGEKWQKLHIVLVVDYGHS